MMNIIFNIRYNIAISNLIQDTTVDLLVATKWEVRLVSPGPWCGMGGGLWLRRGGIRRNWIGIIIMMIFWNKYVISFSDLIKRGYEINQEILITGTVTCREDEGRKDENKIMESNVRVILISTTNRLISQTQSQINPFIFYVPIHHQKEIFLLLILSQSVSLLYSRNISIGIQLKNAGTNADRIAGVLQSWTVGSSMQWTQTPARNIQYRVEEISKWITWEVFTGSDHNFKL